MEDFSLTNATPNYSEKPLTKPQRKTIPFTDISIQTIQESQIQKSLGYEQMQ